MSASALRSCLLSVAFAGGALAGCNEYSAPPEQELEHVYACPQPEPCGIVSAPSGDPGRVPPTSYDEAELCALQALADGDAVLIHYNDGCEGMCYGDAVLTRPDGSVIVQGYQQVFEGGLDFDGISVSFDDWDSSERCELKDSSYFTDCLAAFDSNCVRNSNWYTDCVALTEAESCGL